MIWLGIGLLIGTTLGLTGAGGAILSVPLFIAVLGSSVKEATFLALFSVMAGSLINWFMQRKKTDFKTAFSFFASAIPTTIGFAWIKPSVPDLTIQILFLSVCLWSFASLWWPGMKPKEAAKVAGVHTPLAWIIPAGAFVGMLASLTGLGGGVILIPILFRRFKFPFEKAVATTLLVSFLGSSTSLVSQIYRMGFHLEVHQFGPLLVGIVIAAVAVSAIIKRTSAERNEIVRKFAFSSVVLFALIRVGAEIF